MSFMLSMSVKAQTDVNVIPYGNNKAVGNSISLNGTKQYYEVYGQGEPLVLIHGNGGNIAYMNPKLNFLRKNTK